MNTRTARRRVALAVAWSLGVPISYAATSTWDNGNANWSDPTAWTPDGVPISAADTSLIFGSAGDVGYVSTNDLASPFQLNSLQFISSSAAPNTITTLGGALSFVSNGATTPQITQNGTGAFDLAVGFEAANPLTFGGVGTGQVTLSGVITGAGGLTFNAGNWRISNAANSFTGGVTINTGALVELAPGGALSLAVGATSLLGSNSAANALTLNGGTLKLTTAFGGNITLGAGRPVTFGTNGGLIDIANLDGGVIANNPNDFNLTVNSAAATPAVVRFNGGPNGLSNNDPNNGNWSENNNALRFSGFSGTGTLRIELTNGAMLRAGNGGGSPQTVSLPTIWRGVVGGDPTSGPDGTVVTGISRTTGRVAINVNEITYTNLTMEGALQFGLVGASRALNGNIVIAGSAGGVPGFVNFTGRGTNTQLGPGVAAPGAGTGTAQQHPLWLLRNGNGTFTIQDGGIAAFDVRLRSDTSGRNGNGVALDGPATIQGGGTLLIHQSVTNFTPGVASTIANAGDIIIYGDIIGTGATGKDAVVSIALPEPVSGAPITSAVPILLEAATVDSQRPYGGLRFDDTRGVADLIVNGTGFGGLRVQGIPRPDIQLSDTGAVGGNPMPDPVGTDVKVASVLTAARLSRITGSGGYLTPAPLQRTFTFPVGGEWIPSVPVGLKVGDHNATGVDVSLAAIGTFDHNLAVESGATLDLGAAAPFTIGGSAVIHGHGAIVSSGSVTVSVGAAISPGFDGLGALSITTGTLTLSGGLQIGHLPAASDLLAVTGNLVLGGSLALSGTLGTADVTLASYSGTLAGTFSNITGLSPLFAIDYGTGANSVIKLKYTATPSLVWDGTPGATWSVGGGNWKGGATFAQGNRVLFDSTATGSTSVTISGSNVQPSEVKVDASTVNYTITSAPGAALAGNGQLIKTGAMILTLVGPATYIGGTAVDAGTLALGSANALPDTGTITIGPGATLNTQGNNDLLGDLVVDGTVSGGGTLTVNSLALGSGATFSPNLTLNGNVSKTGAVATTIASNIDLNGAARTFNVDTGSLLAISGILNNGGLTKSGGGELVLNAAVPNAFIGGTTVLGGKLTAGVGSILADTAVTIGAGATLDLTNGGPISYASLNSSGTFNILGSQPLTLAELSGSGGSLNGANGITLSQSTATSYSGAITGVTSVNMNGSGQITLGGASNYSGGLFANTGRVILTSPTAGGSGIVNLGPNGKLASGAPLSSRVDLLGGIFFGVGSPASAASNDIVATAGTTTTISLSDPDNPGVRSEVIFLGTLKGSGDINAVISTNAPHPDGGVGFRLRGTGSSDYSGTIFVGQSVKAEVQTGQAGPFSPAGTGKFVFTAGNFTGGLNGDYSQFNIRNNFAGNTTIGNNVEVVGIGFVNMNMAGGAALDAVTTMGSLRIGDQTLGVNKNGTPSQVLEFTNVTLTGGTPTFAPNTVGFGASGSSDLRLGAISELTPGTGVIMGGQGVLTLAGANTYTGSTTILNGTLRLAASGAIPAVSAVVVDNGTLDLGGPAGSFDQTIGSLAGLGGVITNSDPAFIRTLAVVQNTDTIFAGSINGNVALHKSGTGILALTGFSSPAGETTVSAGSLAVAGTLSGTVNVAAGGTLTSSGIVGNVNVAAGGRIAPGDGFGTLSTGNVILASSALLQMEVSKAVPGLPPGPTDFDTLSVTGSVSLGNAILSLQVGPGIEQNDIFRIIMNDGADPVDGIFAGLANGAFFTAGTQPFQISYFDDASTPNVLELAGGNDVGLLAVPEPGSVALLIGGAFLFAAARRRDEA